MPCYNPIIAFARTPPGERKREIVFATEADKERNMIDRNGHIYGEKLSIPCGQCLGCRLEYSRQWAIRCALEAKQWPENYFVTLTYDPEHVPIREHAQFDPDTGEVMEHNAVMTLRPTDLQKFIKRLRTNFMREYGHTGIRFFACGEYGSQNDRPHYHLILFNCPFEDLKLDHVQDGFAYFRSAMLEKTWPYGMSIVTEFTYQTAAYVARYMLKKHKGRDRDYYDRKGIEPEFTRCSRRPGLGREYYETHKGEMYDWDNLFLSIGDGKVLQTTPPKYFDRLMAEDDPDTLDANKERRKGLAERTMRTRLESTSLGLENYLKVCENNKFLSISHLARNV